MGYNIANYNEQGGAVRVDGGAVIGRVVSTAVDLTLTREHSGALIIVTAADKVITLPSTAAGLRYKILLATAGLSAGTGLSVSPAALDLITGNGFTVADNKDAINTGATDVAGDFIELTGDGSLGYYITDIAGTWAREA